MHEYKLVDARQATVQEGAHEGEPALRLAFEVYRLQGPPPVHRLAHNNVVMVLPLRLIQQFLPLAETPLRSAEKPPQPDQEERPRVSVDQLCHRCGNRPAYYRIRFFDPSGGRESIDTCRFCRSIVTHNIGAALIGDPEVIDLHAPGGTNHD